MSATPADAVAPPASPPDAAPPSAPPTPVIRPQKRPMILIAVVAVIIVIIAGVGIGYEQHWFSPASSSPKATACATGITLQGNGAQFVLPLVDQWASSYQAATSNQVNYPAAGSGTGITDFSENPPLIDFAITDDPLTSSEVSALPATALTLPVTGGALAIIYNLNGLTGHLNLTGQLLAQIYNGNITTWNNAAIVADNPGVALPSATITTVHRSDAAGTTYVLTNLLSLDNPWWASGPGQGISISWPKAPTQVAAKGNSAVLSTVETTANSIGYSDLTDVLTAKTTVQYAAVENPKGNFIAPNLTNTASAIADKSATTTFPSATGNWSSVSLVNAQGAGDYPLATFAYMFVYQAVDKGYEPSASKAGVLVQWLNWVVTTGQTYSNAPDLYYVALPSAIVSIDQAGIQSMTFNGASIPSCT
jgi:phosphate transport system substrate-binding protein